MPVRKIPLLDGNKFGKEELRELTDVIDSGVMSRFGGTKVEQFEHESVETHSTKYGIASPSGTASLHIVIGMLDPPPGDEINVQSRAYSLFKQLSSLLISSVSVRFEIVLGGNCSFIPKFHTNTPITLT